MNDQAAMIEVERYELFEDPSYHFAFDRREFMKALGAGIVLIVPISGALAQEAQRPGQGGESGRGGTTSVSRRTSVGGFTSKKMAASLPSPQS